MGLSSLLYAPDSLIERVYEAPGSVHLGKVGQMTFPLGLTDPYTKLSAIPAGADGFFFISARRLYEVHRGKQLVRHGPNWDNVMALLPDWPELSSPVFPR